MYFINYRTFHFQMQPLNGKLHKRTNTHAHPYTHARTHANMYVCMYKCIFVFHFFCFCFASCFLFGAVLLTWLKLEHNNNKSLQWNFATHTREHAYMYVCMHVSHTHTHSELETLQRAAYTFVLLLLLLLLLGRSLRLKKKINKFLFALFTAISHTFHAVRPINFISYALTYIYFVFCDNL